MAGVSVGGGSAKQTSSAGTLLEQLGSQLIGEQQGLRQTLIGKLSGLLAGNGANPATKLDPSGAIEASRLAEAKTLRETADSMAKSGLGGTPFGEGIIASQRMAGNYNVSQIAPAYENQSKQNQLGLLQTILQLIPQYLTGTQQGVSSGLGAAVGGNTRQSGQQAGFSMGIF